MRLFFLAIMLLPMQAFAKAPECPLYANVQECLQSVEDNYESLLDFINQEEEDNRDKLIEAAVNVKFYESRACQKTCVN